jgi:VanZ family protein
LPFRFIRGGLSVSENRLSRFEDFSALAIEMVASGKRSDAKGRGRKGWSRLRRYGPLVIWMGFIYFASRGEFSAGNTSRIIGPFLRWLFPDISEEQLALAHLFVRKTAHFVEYAVLAWLAARAFSTSRREGLRRSWFLLALLLVVLYALGDEYHQSLIPARTGSIYDSLIDMSGGLAALLLYAFWRRRVARKAGDGKRMDST